MNSPYGRTGLAGRRGTTDAALGGQIGQGEPFDIRCGPLATLLGQRLLHPVEAVVQVPASTFSPDDQAEPGRGSDDILLFRRSSAKRRGSSCLSRLYAYFARGRFGLAAHQVAAFARRSRPERRSWPERRWGPGGAGRHRRGGRGPIDDRDRAPSASRDPRLRLASERQVAFDVGDGPAIQPIEYALKILRWERVVSGLGASRPSIHHDGRPLAGASRGCSCGLWASDLGRRSRPCRCPRTCCR